MPRQVMNPFTGRFDTVVSTLDELTNVTITSTTDRDRLIWDSASSQWVNLPSVTAATHEPGGFENRTDSVLAFDSGTREFSITAAVTDWKIWVSGERITLTGPDTDTVSAATGTTYFYYDSAGVLQQSDSFPSLANTAIVASIYWNNATGDYLFGEERHGITMDWATHSYLHTTVGAAYKSGGDITRTLSDTTLAGNQIALTETVYLDEDIEHTLAAWVAGTTWQKWYIDASGNWLRLATDDNLLGSNVTVPNFFTADPLLGYNDTTAGTIASIGLNDYVNVFVLGTNDKRSAYRFIVLCGQADHANTSSAYAETIDSLSFGNLPIPELKPLYQLTYQRVNTGIGCQMVRSLDIRKTRALGVPSTAASTHNALSGLQGGSVGEYYHLTAADYANLAGGAPTFATSVATPMVKATSSAGLVLANASGTACLTLGAGGGVNATFADGINVGGCIDHAGAVLQLGCNSATGVDIGNVTTTVTTNIYGDTVNIGEPGGTVNLLGAVNNINATDVFVPNDLEVDGVIYADGGIDRATAATLAIGATNATQLDIGRAGVDNYLIGTTRVTGDFIISTPNTFTATGPITIGATATISVGSGATITGTLTSSTLAMTGAVTWNTAQSFPGITLTNNSNFGSVTIAGTPTWSGAHTFQDTLTLSANKSLTLIGMSSVNPISITQTGDLYGLVVTNNTNQTFAFRVANSTTDSSAILIGTGNGSSTSRGIAILDGSFNGTAGGVFSGTTYAGQVIIGDNLGGSPDRWAQFSSTAITLNKPVTVSASKASGYVFDITNTGGADATYSALKVSTSTASTARIISLQNAGTERFAVTGAGDILFGNNGNTGSISAAGAVTLGPTTPPTALNHTFNGSTLILKDLDKTRSLITSEASTTYLDSAGVDTSTNGSFVFRTYRSDDTNIITAGTISSTGQWTLGPSSLSSELIHAANGYNTTSPNAIFTFSNLASSDTGTISVGGSSTRIRYGSLSGRAIITGLNETAADTDNKQVYIGDNGILNTNTSIRASKMNIEPVSVEVLPELMRVVPSTFNRRVRDNANNCYTDTPEGRVEVGLIADDIQQECPFLAQTTLFNDSEGNLLGIHMDRYAAVLVKAIQELAAKNAALEARLAALETA